MKRFFLLSALLVCPLLASESFGGIGVTIIPAREGVRVVDVIPNTPAALAGLEKGDRVIAVDARSLTGKTFDEAKDALRGQAGKPVEVSVIREKDTLSFTVRRSVIAVREISDESIKNWYGEEKSEYSKEELEVVASQSAKSNESLASVLNSGYIVENAQTRLSDVTAVFVENETVFDEPKVKTAKAPAQGSAKLKAFNREQIAFSATVAGATKITVTDASGLVYLETIVSANAGANFVSWNGSAAPSDRYSIRFEHLGTVSSYFAVLK